MKAGGDWIEWRYWLAWCAICIGFALLVVYGLSR